MEIKLYSRDDTCICVTKSVITSMHKGYGTKKLIENYILFFQQVHPFYLRLIVLDAGSANVIISWLEKGLPNFFLFAYFSRNQYYRVCLAVGAPMAVAEPRLPHAALVLGPPLAAAV